MILTAPEIEFYVKRGEIIIEPFDRNLLGTVSYHFRAGKEIGILDTPLDDRIRTDPTYETISSSGFVLLPGRVYLLSTLEVMGSTIFAQQIFGTLTTGNKGLFIDVSANLGHVGSVTRWTLELVATYPIKIHSGQRIGQIIFWGLQGGYWSYDGSYQDMTRPLPSQIWKEVR